jgi:hypothetical protein
MAQTVIVLSNGRFIGRQGGRLRFGVDYQFQQGGPVGGARYFWIIRSDQGVVEFGFGAHEMKNQDTLVGNVLGALGDRGPWSMYIEVQELAPGRGLARRRISNTISVRS